ncbi:MAG TPA: SDR family oxidoreductase [Candidatus Babeliales bacterium]|nr:SDR family oxidoreductase [Candidatus Babeliales bacterium]
MEQQYICIVGGSGGIGAAIVNQYAKLPNTSVVVIDQKPLANESLAENVELIQIDVTKVSEIISAAEGFQSRDVHFSHLISLAGGALHNEWSKLELIPDQTIEDSIKLNLVSHILLTKYLMRPEDITTDRSIVFVSSINALKSYHLTVYSAAKAGLLGLTRELAGSLSPGIRVNAILPGTIETPRTKKEPKDFDSLKRETLLERFAKPEDVAAACHFLTHLTDAITGAEIVVDAGQSISTK